LLNKLNVIAKLKENLIHPHFHRVYLTPLPQLLIIFSNCSIHSSTCYESSRAKI